MLKELLGGDRGVVGIYLTPILPKTEKPLYARTLLIAVARCNRTVRCEYIQGGPACSDRTKHCDVRVSFGRTLVWHMRPLTYLPVRCINEDRSRRRGRERWSGQDGIALCEIANGSGGCQCMHSTLASRHTINKCQSTKRKSSIRS